MIAEKHEKKREYMREYMRNYRAAHPEYCKRNTKQCVERKRLDPEKWRAYMHEYMREHRSKYRMSKADIIKAICESPDYRFTHDEMMRMRKKELLEYYPKFKEAKK